PPGLSLNGRTGEISGAPDSAGTFFLTLSITDRGENDNKVITIMPLSVLPAASDFRFTTVLVDNGEAGTPYQDLILTEGGSGSVGFAATGLPPGLAIDAATGEITGTPTTAGMFEMFLTAVDADGPITTNRRVQIVPSSTSNLYWDYSGVPAAIYNVRYDRTPPILVAAKGGTTITYSAIGLPEGMTYDAGTGEIRGTSSDVGVYPVTFRATDDPSGESLVLPVDFIVLPAGGGDARDIAVNLWVSKQKVKTGRPGRDRWKAVFVYNADRRAGQTFDPETDVLQFSIGARILELGPETLVRAKRGKAKYKAVLEDGTRVKVKVLATKQLVKLKSSRDRIGETLPGTFRSTVVLGGRGYRLDEFLGEKGRFRVTSGYRSTAFVVPDARLTIRGPGSDAVALRLLLADPGFAYESGGEVRLRLLSGDTVLFDKEFTDLVEVTEARARKTGETGQRLRLAAGDPAETNRVTAFVYDSLSGEAAVTLMGLDLSGVPEGEAHLGVELTVGEKTYFTTVTVFGPKRGAYTTRMPRK
ncbi:MAG: Ig domain-containing protein, partial [Planctomycetota bacterium]